MVEITNIIYFGTKKECFVMGLCWCKTSNNVSFLAEGVGVSFLSHFTYFYDLKGL